MCEIFNLTAVSLESFLVTSSSVLGSVIFLSILIKETKRISVAIEL